MTEQKLQQYINDWLTKNHAQKAHATILHKVLAVGKPSKSWVETIQRYVHPLVWDPVIQKILLAPSWFVFGVLWFLLALAGRRRKSRCQDRYSA